MSGKFTITFKHHGDFSKTFNFFDRCQDLFKMGVFDKYGRMGIESLSALTPKDSGKTSRSWNYDIEISRSFAKISWYNTNVNDGANIAILLQYGHGTGTGGYVQGIDYINPAMRPIFDELVNAIWKEVTTT